MPVSYLRPVPPIQSPNRPGSEPYRENEPPETANTQRRAFHKDGHRRKCKPQHDCENNRKRDGKRSLSSQAHSTIPQ
jgi:hypothetical protein